MCPCSVNLFCGARSRRYATAEVAFGVGAFCGRRTAIAPTVKENGGRVGETGVRGKTVATWISVLSNGGWTLLVGRTASLSEYPSEFELAGRSVLFLVSSDSLCH